MTSTTATALAIGSVTLLTTAAVNWILPWPLDSLLLPVVVTGFTYYSIVKPESVKNAVTTINEISPVVYDAAREKIDNMLNNK